MAIKVSSEIGHLESVIVHTPGHEVSLVNPELRNELLFDDIIFEEDARKEHLGMLDLFKAAMPKHGKVLEVVDLFLEAVEKEDARAFFIENLIREFPEENLSIIEQDLLKLSPQELVTFSTQGILPGSNRFSLLPSPNLLFTRDLAAVVNDTILISRAATKTRLRESLMMETIIFYHPLFESVKDKAIKIGGNQSIEGGDVLIESKDLVLIGMSVRTSFTGLMKAAEGMLNHGVKTVLAVDIPKQRASMHLDTIFTFASNNECVAFPPAIMEQQENVVALQKVNGAIQAEARFSLHEALNEFSGKEYTFIKCGGEDRTNQFREQWTDGANVFALASGVIVGYERNTKTFNTLVDHGYSYMNQYEFIEEFAKKGFVPNNDMKIAVSFEGHELCRGRGGARCMTMPISRSDL